MMLNKKTYTMFSAVFLIIHFHILILYFKRSQKIPIKLSDIIHVYRLSKGLFWEELQKKVQLSQQCPLPSPVWRMPVFSRTLWPLLPPL